MALVQIRDVPEHIYRLLVEQAVKERRSLAQQAVAVLARGLEVEVDAKARRRKILQMIKAAAPTQKRKLSDPVKLIRQDRER
jgi:hypothetical protein